jgi:hypothetical protein
MNNKDRLVQNLKQVNGIVCDEFSRSILRLLQVEVEPFI